MGSRNQLTLKYKKQILKFELKKLGFPKKVLGHSDAGWSSLVARRAHNPKVVSSNLAPATNFNSSIKSVFTESRLPFQLDIGSDNQLKI
jgi:hypothetical protein